MNTTTGIMVPVVGRDAPEPAFCCAGCGRRQPRPAPVLRAAPPARPFTLVSCRQCGLVQRLEPEAGATVASQRDEEAGIRLTSDQEHWSEAVQRYLVHLRAYERPGGPRLLHVGCARGHLAALARARGWRVVGLDLSAQAASDAAGRFGIEVRAGTLALHRDTLYPFDAVLMTGCLARASRPATMLENAGRVLARGGRICIETPNWDSPWRRWFPRTWKGLDSRDLSIFVAGSLTRLLEQAGFGDVRTGACTGFRDELWSSRPELQRWVTRLPRFVRGWAERRLARRPRRARWTLLRADPPTDLESALRRVDEWEAAEPDPTEAGDLLIAHGQRR